MNGFHNRPPVMLHIPELDPSRRAAWQARLDSYQRRCGCRVGMAAMLVAIVACSAAIVRAYADLSWLQLAAIMPAALVAAFLAGLLGKFATLYVTRLQFAGACRRIADELSPGDTGP